jgi:glycosyltransferase involved in cell wall biosynthesis
MSEYHERYLREKGIIKPFIRLPHGVYTDEFVPDIGADVRTDLGIDDDELAVGVVGTLNYSKKQGVGYGWTLIEAIAKLDESAPVKAVLIGGGDGLDYFKDRIQELGIEDKVVLTGHIQHEDLPSYLGALDVGVLVKPDHPADKMAPTMKLPEYLSAGLYVIADDNAFASTILNEECASLIRYDGIRDRQFPQSLAKELARLVADPDRVQRGQIHSRELAEEMFDYRHLQRNLREGIEALFKIGEGSER